MKTPIDRSIEAAHHLADAEPPPWRDIIAGACDFLGATGGVFIQMEDRQFVTTLQDFGTDPAAVRDYQEHFHSYDILLPWSDSAAGRWLDTERVMSKAQLIANEYYADFMCKHRMPQILCHFLESEPHHTATISFQREHAAPGHGIDELFASTPVRHFLASARDALRLRRERESAWLQSVQLAFEQFDEGVALIERSGRVAHLSETAAAALGGPHELRLRAGRLWHPDDRIRRILEDSIARAHIGAAVGPLVVPSIAAPSLVLTLQFVLAQWPRQTGRAPALLCRVKPHDRCGPPPTMKALAAVYQLTEAELGVLQELVAGKSAQEIADETNTSLNNIRKRIDMLLSKTGCSKQSALIRLATSGH
ncbi:LuxR C-terminal-related transcriptional regulator [Variovorax sp. Sphag1AA]|uniref:helix-turn-helix transcriptional regulator n=1 Tax=Variovorax sp. Sphag1AA TaxID=2587027 RepID=UPI00160A6F72|nr:LuxR C-terminal-related transcriptional regulator [Variovorax sp. Sphag1AA]MBB3182021.1 DNA-binding CsgD family transcriptional regulator/PAS domain-containing protein [Variovorax sp. Sphag1AA]